MDKITTKNAEYRARKAVVYVEKTAIDELLGKWFMEHNIYSFKWKCNTWTWLSKKRNTVISERINKLLKVDQNCKVVWSAYAGCSCSCSPGFLIKRGGRNERRILIDNQAYSSIWVDINTDDVINSFKNYITVAEKKLAKEKLKHPVEELVAK